MKVRQLLDELATTCEVLGDDDVDVTGLTLDSRSVGPATMFCCVPGGTVDGHDFAGAAVSAGAVALLCERPLASGVTEVVVPSARVLVGPVADVLNGRPSDALCVVGITGTNGKSTTAAFLEAILSAAGRRTEVIGTLHPIPGGPPTSPDAPQLQVRLAELRDRHVTDVVMEVSSHSLAQHRVDGTRFRVAVFTNLSRDHLDFHHTLDEYFAAKARLFRPELSERAVVNVDDAHGRELAARAAVPTTTYSLADVEGLRVGLRSAEGTWRGRQLVVPLGGEHNVQNALAALTTAELLGVDPATAVAGLAAVPPVSGRLEPVEAGQPFTVLVDYAHTPDGLEQALRTARQGGGRVIVVFGAGGDKDREKRPLMGEVAARLADLVVVTSDNPRTEDPATIIDAVVAGTGGSTRVVTEVDRRAAIALALAEARPGDVVLLAGKGHETTQQIGSRLIPFDDRLVAMELLGGGAA